MKRKWIVVLTLVLAAAAATVILFLQPESREWTEDVALDDGTIITIERYVEFDSSNALAGDAYSTSLRKAKLAFNGTLSDMPVWTELLMPLVLYRDRANGQLVIVAKTSDCDVWGARGKPNPPYWEFRVQGDRWVETPLSASSIGRRSNLFYLYSQRLHFDHLRLADKNRFLSDPRLGETYQRILPPQDFFCADDLRLRNK